LEAQFCPNCGATISKADTENSFQWKQLIRPLFAGLLGGFLSITLSSFVNLYFISSFLTSILVIYIFRINGLRDATITSLATYLFADGLFGVLLLGELYIARITLSEVYSTVGVPGLLDVISYGVSPFSAFLAGYIGKTLTPSRKRDTSDSPTYTREKGPGGVVYCNLE
jgi:hypothetical protein